MITFIGNKQIVMKIGSTRSNSRRDIKPILFLAVDIEFTDIRSWMVEDAISKITGTEPFHE